MACAAAALGLAAAAWADGWSLPPYTLFPYVADTTDNPPLNYTKVCEPGATTEAQASYVVVGVWYPRAYQGVTTGYTGDLVIPETIDGLPVRKIADNAFAVCQKLTSVTVPANCREVGEYAFGWCTSLTNVTFREGTASIGPYAFSNCVNLASVTLPKSLSFIGEGCFEKTWALQEVRFLGNAPRLDWGARPGKGYLGEKWYDAGNPQPRFTVVIDPATKGWLGPGRKGVPEKWPLEFGWMQAYPVRSERSTSGFVLSIANTGRER